VDARAEVVSVWAGVGKDVDAGLCAVVAAECSSNSGISLGMFLLTSAMAYCPLIWILSIQSWRACGRGLSRYESSYMRLETMRPVLFSAQSWSR